LFNAGRRIYTGCIWSSGKLDPKAKRQITQLLDTFIEREELKQRVNAQGA